MKVCSEAFSHAPVITAKLLINICPVL